MILIMKNETNPKKEHKRQEKKVAVKRVRESWRKSIIADLKMKFGNEEIEKNMPQIQKQIDGLEIELFENTNG